MKITIDYVGQFRDAFHHAGRGKQFSYDGLELLFDYLEEHIPDYDLDVVELCCEYSEDSLEEIIENYGIEINSNDSEEDQLQQVKDFLESATIMVGITSIGAIVYAQF